MATNEEQTAVDPVSESLARTSARDSAPVIARTEASLRPAQPRRTPTGTPSIPVSGPPLADPSTALPKLPRATTVRAQSAAPVRPASVPPPLPRAITGAQPIVGRAPTAQAIPSIVGRAPTQSGSQTVMGLSPVVGRAPTSQPAIGRAPSQSIPPLTGRAPTQSQPIAGRASTQSGVDAHAHTALALPSTGSPRAATRSDTSRVRGSTVIPVPPLAVPASLPAVAPTLHAMPQAPAVAHASTPIAAAPATPSAPIQTATFAAPAAAPPPARASSVAMPAIAAESSAPANVTVSFSGLPPQIAAAIAAAPASARPLAPHLSLPPYVPAPNVGDPGEAIETVRVEKVELTELVDKYAPLPVERVAELEEVPRAFEVKKVGRTLVRFAPAIGLVALVLTFVIGFLIFDGEGRHTMKTVKAPAAAEVKPAPAADTTASKTAAPAVATDEAKPDANPAPADVAAAADDKRGPETVAATAADKPVARPARGKIYIRSNKPAQIFLDGKSANAVTPRQLTVRPGTHKVTLWETTSGKTVTQYIEVPADKVVTVSKKFD